MRLVSGTFATSRSADCREKDVLGYTFAAALKGVLSSIALKPGNEDGEEDDSALLRGPPTAAFEDATAAAEAAGVLAAADLTFASKLAALDELLPLPLALRFGAMSCGPKG